MKDFFFFLPFIILGLALGSVVPVARYYAPPLQQPAPVVVVVYVYPPNYSPAPLQ